MSSLTDPRWNGHWIGTRGVGHENRIDRRVKVDREIHSHGPYRSVIAKTDSDGMGKIIEAAIPAAQRIALRRRVGKIFACRHVRLVETQEAAIRTMDLKGMDACATKADRA